MFAVTTEWCFFFFFKAAVTTDHPLYFQFKFARLRSDMLRAYSQLLTCCSSLKLNPLPNIAMTSSVVAGPETHHLNSGLAMQVLLLLLLLTLFIGKKNVTCYLMRLSWALEVSLCKK